MNKIMSLSVLLLVIFSINNAVAQKLPTEIHTNFLNLLVTKTMTVNPGEETKDHTTKFQLVSECKQSACLSNCEQQEDKCTAAGNTDSACALSKKQCMENCMNNCSDDL